MNVRLAACWAVLLVAVPLGAQERDASVLRPGELRLSTGADFLRNRAGPGDRHGDRLPPTGPFALTPDNFRPVAATAAALGRLLEEVGGPPELAGGISAGDLTTELVSSTRIVPIGAAIGILSRLELGGTLPIYRNELLLSRAAISAGNLGLNPSPAGNATLLATIDPSFEELGGGALLPVAASPLGIELQRLVMEATGEALELPATALSAPDLLANFDLHPLRHTVTDWTIGDLEIHARFELLSTFHGRQYPDTADLDYRVRLEGALRLPTGAPADSILEGLGMEAGAGGGRVGAAADLFVGDRFWISGGGSWARQGEIERRLGASAWIPASGEDILTRGPSTGIELYLLPRIRLSREISVGTTLSYSRGSVTVGGGSSMRQSRTGAGFTLRYSTHPASEAGASILPAEVAFGYGGTLASSDSAAKIGTAFLKVSIFPRLWGSPPALAP